MSVLDLAFFTSSSDEYLCLDQLDEEVRCPKFVANNKAPSIIAPAAPCSTAASAPPPPGKLAATPSRNCEPDERLSSSEWGVDNWDQDVLLPNSGLPDAFLGSEGASYDDDFQKMLSEWESHIGSLETTTQGSAAAVGALEDHEVQIKEESDCNDDPQHLLEGNTDDDQGPKLSAAGQFCEKNYELGQQARRAKVSTGEDDDHAGAAYSFFEVFGDGRGDNLVDDDDHQRSPLPHMELDFLASGDTTDPSVVIVGSPAAAPSLMMSPSSSAAAEEIAQALKDLKHEAEDADDDLLAPEGLSMEVDRQRSAAAGENFDQSSQDLSNVASSKKSGGLAGVVVSCGPEGHFETYAVLEADDVENLLEKFEATEENNQLLRSGSSSDELATLDFSPATRDPHKRSQIIAAVENHFSINSSSSSSRVPIKSESASTPRIVLNQKIKGALPKEIVERIRASSVKSRTIAIIEPVISEERPEDAPVSMSTAPASTASNSLVASSKPVTSVVGNVSRTRGHHQGIFNSSSRGHTFHYRRASFAASGGPSIATTRFHDAASNLNKARQVKLGCLGVASNQQYLQQACSSGSTNSSGTANLNQLHVHLDHDYCSPVNKSGRRSKVMLNTAVSSSPALWRGSSGYGGDTVVIRGDSETRKRLLVSPPLHVASNASKGASALSPPSSNGITIAPPQTLSSSGTVASRGLTTTSIVVQRNSGGLSSYPATTPSSATGAATQPSGRPYVRVSTGCRIVTANLLKPSVVTSSGATGGRQAVILSSTRSSSSSATVKPFGKAGGSGSSRDDDSVIKPESRLVFTRRDSSSEGPDLKKDSGLESEEVSDESCHLLYDRDDEPTMPGTTPAATTTATGFVALGAAAASASSSSSASDEGSNGCYDRLPAYIVGIVDKKKKVVVLAGSGRGRPGPLTGQQAVPTVEETMVLDQAWDGATDAGAAGAGQEEPPVLRRSQRIHHASGNPDEDSSWPRTPSSSTLPPFQSLGHKESSSSATIDDSDDEDGDDDDDGGDIANGGGKLPRHRYLQHRRLQVEQQQQPSSGKRVGRAQHLRKRSSGSSSSTSSSPPRKISAVAGGKRRRSRRREDAAAAAPPSPLHAHQVGRHPHHHHEASTAEQQLQRRSSVMTTEERRVVYVGKVAEGTTRADLRKRFEAFGPILEISVHFRDHGDNYGFVTFKYTADAYKAIERGNDDPALPKVDICFGGRRAFCQEKYSDLDSMAEDPLYRGGYPSVGNGHHRSVPPRHHRPPKKSSLDRGPVQQQASSAVLDFDALLEQARVGLKRQK